MVGVIAVCMLHILHTTWTLEFLCRSRVVSHVEVESQDVESLLSVAQVVVTPEVFVSVACTHHSGFAALVGVETIVRILSHVVTECILKVGRGTSPAAPAVTKFVEAIRHEVALL